MEHAFEELLNELRECQTLTDSVRLHHLSALEAAEIERLREAWPELSADVRCQIAARLVELAEADFELDFCYIFRLGLEDEHAKVRESSIQGLWEDEDVRLIPLLITRLTEEESSDVRAAAATSLGRFLLLGELEKIRRRPFNRVYEALLAAHLEESETVEVRRRALESLAYVGREEITELIQLAYHDPNESMRVSAVFAMGRSSDQRWAKYVKQELLNPSPEFRYEAARACGELQLREAVIDLEELADDVDSAVQEATLWSLGQIGGNRAREILQRYVNSDDEATSAAAEAALNELEFLCGDLGDLFSRLADTPDEVW